VRNSLRDLGRTLAVKVFITAFFLLLVLFQGFFFLRGTVLVVGLLER